MSEHHADHTPPHSGVLALSIERSRQKWLTGGLFERYWAKPSKKRTLVDASNPSKESMTRLGSCSMIIEPHVFEITLYTVKEKNTNHTPPNIQLAPQSHPLPPDMRYSSFSHVAIYHSAPQGLSGPGPQSHDQERLKSSQPTLPPFKEGFTQFGPQAPPLYHNQFAAPNKKLPAPTLSENGGINGSVLNSTQPQEPKPSPDPVIQMLATRAAADHDLKALMKVVASGNASPEQLETFQNQIDELNDILKSRNQSSQAVKDEGPNGLQSDQGPSSQLLVSTSTLSNGQMPKATTAYASPKPATTSVKQGLPPQYFSHYTQPPKSKTITPFKPDISAVVFDLGGSGDRFLFPRFSILEFLSGGTQVIVSFLLIRSGSAAACKGCQSYKETVTYYQPVTMRLSTSHPRNLEPLSRVVAPADEVRRYMNSIFDKMSPAENAFLAIQLPRSLESTSVERGNQHAPQESAVLKAVYSPPSAITPLRT